MCRCVATCRSGTSARAGGATGARREGGAPPCARRAACAAPACSPTSVAASSATLAPTAPSSASATDTPTARVPTNSTNVSSVIITPPYVLFRKCTNKSYILTGCDTLLMFLQGNQCEKCMPNFVGDPVNNVQCVPCSSYCYGHTLKCTNEGEPVSAAVEGEEFYRDAAPSTRARCVRCANNTDGQRCERCIEGYFRGSEDFRDPCRP